MSNYSLPKVLLLFALYFNFAFQLQAQNFHVVKDINTSTDSDPRNIKNSSADSLVVLNGIAYFAANDGVHDFGLFRSDGTDAGTYQLKEGVNPENIIVSNGKIFFSTNRVNGLWTSDGTAAGTHPVLTTLPAGITLFDANNLADANGVVYFAITGEVFSINFGKRMALRQVL